jgi:Gpi18-like mannosyltransferase
VAWRQVPERVPSSILSKTSSPLLVAGLAFLVGIGIRLFALDYRTPDWEVFLLPWYEHARLHGFAGLKDGVTNYAPFYTYLLVVAAAFDGWASPLTLVKCISFPFELGCALVAARLVRTIEPRPEREALAFAAIWLSPGFLHNGAFWGQCDAIWTFFLLLALWAVCLDRVRWAVLAFAMAMAVKLQAIFFAPFLLGYILRRRESLAWFGLVPAVYVLVAVPALAIGRPWVEVASVYLGQAGTFPYLWKGAANLYNLISETFYHPVMEIGLALAALCGRGLAWAIARARVLTLEGRLLAAALSLALMPFLLPKMHERFFFAFDAVIVILACLRPLYVPVAIAALVNSIACYLPFDGRGDFAQAVAGLQSLVIILFLGHLLRKSFAGQPIGTDPDREKLAFLRPTAALWFSYLAYCGGKLVLGLWLGRPAGIWPDVPAEPLGLVVFLACLVSVTLLLRRMLPASGTPA